MSEVGNTPFSPYTTPTGVQWITFHTCSKCWHVNEYHLEFRDGHFPGASLGAFAVCDVCGNEWALPHKNIFEVGR